MGKSHSRLILLVALIVMVVHVGFVFYNGSTITQCPLEGPGSSAPTNVDEFRSSTDAAVASVRSRLKKTDPARGLTILCTSVNHAAAKNNLPVFYQFLAVGAIVF